MDTFVVRLYAEHDADRTDEARLRGVVEEISTGSRATFRGGAELLAILGHSQQERREVPGLRPDLGPVSRAD